VNDPSSSANSSSPNGSALAKVASQLNLPTLGLILAMGGGNLFQGITSSEANKHEIDRAIREVHDLHEKLDETDARQLKALANQQEILEALRARQRTQ
jgi:ABC-type phosphate transport system auxiliary subunit